MEPSEAELFAVLESEVRDIDRDVTSQVRNITRGVELFYWQRWGNEVPFEQVNLYSFSSDELSAISESLSLKARREWYRDGALPGLNDLVTFRITNGYMPYQVYDKEMKKFVGKYFDEEQWVSGKFRTLAVNSFMPEHYLNLEYEWPEDDATVTNPLGLHAVIENATIGSREPGEYKPQASDWLYIPLHYDTLRVSVLPAPAEKE